MHLASVAVGTSECVPDVHMFNATGAQVYVFGANNGAGPDGSTPGVLSPFTVTNSGTYTVVIKARDNVTAGAYNLGLTYLTPKCPARC